MEGRFKSVHLRMASYSRAERHSDAPVSASRGQPPRPHRPGGVGLAQGPGGLYKELKPVVATLFKASTSGWPARR